MDGVAARFACRMALPLLLGACAIAPPPAVIGEPILVSRELPEMPPEALQAGHNGRVIVAIEVDASGAVRTVRVERSSGSALLDDETLRVARSSVYRAARDAQGRPVASSDRLRLNFPGRREPTCAEYLRSYDWLQSVPSDQPLHMQPLFRRAFSRYVRHPEDDHGFWASLVPVFERFVARCRTAGRSEAYLMMFGLVKNQPYYTEPGSSEDVDAIVRTLGGTGVHDVVPRPSPR